LDGADGDLYACSMNIGAMFLEDVRRRREFATERLDLD
jgi:hypothetical protein